MTDTIRASDAAIEKANIVAGQYLEWLGKTDLMKFTPEEFNALMKAIADEVVTEDCIPF